MKVLKLTLVLLLVLVIAALMWGVLVEPHLVLVGIGSHYARNDAPLEALADLPPGAPRIVLMHNPDSFAAIAAGQAPFAVAGHRHAGQIRLPGTATWTWMNLLADDEIHADGLIEPEYGQPGNSLYVNRGIGFSVVPIRINARPEITWFRLEPP